MSGRLPREDLQHVLDHTRELWEEMRGCRIFVTGSTGFFGSWLLESFAYANDQLGLGAKLLGLTRDAAAFARKAPHLVRHPAISMWEGDVRDFKFPDGEFSHVVHAATPFIGLIEPLEIFDAIVTGTRHVLDFSIASGARKFLLVSSGAVYGAQPTEMTSIPETYTGGPDPSDPNAAYGEGKRMAELLCAIYRRNHDLEPKIARCFAFAGPHLQLDAHYAISNFIRDALAGGPIHVSGDGRSVRSYLYAADLAIWLWTILFSGKACWPYNVGSEEGICTGDLAKVVAEACQPTLEVIVDKVANPAIPVSRYICDCARAHTLSLRDRFPLHEQIRRTLAWHHAASIDTQ